MSQRKLTRSRDHRVIAGVCGGIAEYFEIDVTIVRLVAGAACLFSAGLVVACYLAGWLILPDARTGESGADALYERYGDYRQRRASRERNRTDQPPADSFSADEPTQ